MTLLARYEINGATYGLSWKGPYLVTGGSDKTVRVWDERGNRPYILNEPDALIASLSWANDSRLASGSEDGKVFVWDLNNGQTQGNSLSQDNGQFTNVAWSPDGRRLAYSTVGGTIKVYNFQNNQTMTFNGHKDVVRTLAWSPDSQRLATASFDKTVKIWNMQTGQPLTLGGHTKQVLAVTWSPDGRRVVSGAEDGTLRVWDAGSGRQLSQTPDLGSWVRSVAWSPDGNLIVSANYDGFIRFWSYPDLKQAAPDFRVGGRGTAVSFHPDGRLAVVGDNGSQDNPGNISYLYLIRPEML